MTTQAREGFFGTGSWYEREMVMQISPLVQYKGMHQNEKQKEL